MPTMAQWGPKAFLLSPSQIIMLGDFSTSVELKSDSENDTSGTSPINTRGLLPRPVSFSVAYIRAAGVDPRAQLEEWESLVGKSNPLYIGGKRFGPNSLILKKVEASDFVFSANGDFLSVNVMISLGENSGEKKSSTTKVASAKTVSSSGTVYADTVAKRKAMNATAPPSDRIIKKAAVAERRLLT